MPVNVNDLKKHVSDSPVEIAKLRESTARAARDLLASMAPSQRTQMPLEHLVPVNLINAEAEARQVNRDVRDLTRDGNEELQRLREEVQHLRRDAVAQTKKADAAARNDRLWQVILGLLLAIVSWLLGALSAGQLFSHLLHP